MSLIPENVKEPHKSQVKTCPVRKLVSVVKWLVSVATSVLGRMSIARTVISAYYATPYFKMDLNLSVICYIKSGFYHKLMTTFISPLGFFSIIVLLAVFWRQPSYITV